MATQPSDLAQIKQLSERYGSDAKRQIGSVFKFLKHNYGVGLSRDDILTSLHNSIKKGATLQEIFEGMGFYDLQNKRDARTISLMVTDSDQWTVRFAEILLKDRQAILDRILTFEYVDQVGILVLFFVQYNLNLNSAKKLAMLIVAGGLISELTAYTTQSMTMGTGVIIYTIGGNIVRRLLNQRSSTMNTIQLFIFLAAIATSVWVDPPVKETNYISGMVTDHLYRLIGFAAGWFI